MDEALLRTLADIGITPKDPTLYVTAFTHRSFLNESKETLQSNERFEFLGDSILSFIVSSHIFKLRPLDEEGDLTNLRSYIIKTDSLAKASIKLGLGEHLRLSKGEELSGGRNNIQLMANTFEAVLGAIFLDQGIEKAQEFVHQALLPLFASELENGAPKDAKSQLQEVMQNKTKQSPRYKVLETTGPDHAKQFVVGVFLSGEEIGRGEGTNKQQAEEEAAKKALIKLTEGS